MTPKRNERRKSLYLWQSCNNCKAVLQHKYFDIHKDWCNQNSDDWNWTHDFVKDNIFNGILDVNIDLDVIINDSINKVFLSMDVMKMCNILLRDPVVLHFENTSIVKLAWIKDHLNGSNISLLQTAIDLDLVKGLVRLHKLTESVYHADKIIIKYKGKYELPPLRKLTMFLKAFNQNKIVTIGNRITFSYHAKSFTCTIIDIKSNETEKNENLSSQMENLGLINNNTSKKIFYKIDYKTNFKIHQEREPKLKFKYKLNNIGGYENLINDIKNIIDLSTSHYDNYPQYIKRKGILLHGSSNVGKTMIAEAILNDSNNTVVVIDICGFYGKIFSIIEHTLISQFEEAKCSAPSIIYIKKLDILFRNKTDSENNRKILHVLIKLMEEIQNFPIIMMVTATQLENIDALLRKPGRLDIEFEVVTPTQNIRRQIIVKMLKEIDHDLSNDNINHIATVTHGYVGADLQCLCSEAISNAVCENDNFFDPHVKVKLAHFINALKKVQPLAMKEISVDLCKVKWEDIGGQKDLKLMLKQAVEWPLNHPEVFVKFGIVPPKGLLMYGPPGCSKTMIAKALATETKMNFLNLKSSNLFSKWVGDSEKAVSRIFKKARQVAPSIIFIDEIDTIGKEGGKSTNDGGSNVEEKVLVELLMELDGVTKLENVFVIAATNRPDKIDPALLRPGRFDRVIYVPLPNAETRGEIFNIKCKKMPLNANVDLKTLVDRTEGYTGAEIQEICNEASLHALKLNFEADKVTMDDFEETLSIVKPRTTNELIKIYDKFNKTIS